MELEEIKQRLDESIGVPAFYIGKAFKISRYQIDELKDVVNITALPFKNIDVKISDIEQFFSDYQYVFALMKKKPPLEIANDSDTEFGMATEKSKGSTLLKTTKPMSKEKEDTTTEVMLSNEEIKVTVSNLTNLLLQNIKRVQDDPKYIPQAKSINNDVNSIINLAKLQITLINSQK